jgi:uncharacterized protein YdaU (DUF1376 family)
MLIYQIIRIGTFFQDQIKRLHTTRISQETENHNEHKGKYKAEYNGRNVSSG